MSLSLGPRHVVAPDGVEWRVGRRWLTQRFRWSWRRRRNIAAESLTGLGPFDGADSGEGLLLTLGLVAVVVVLIPILFFGVELIILGALVAGGLVARAVLRQPWVIEARSTDAIAPERLLEWRVRGWRKGGKLIDRVVSDLAAGREPADATA